jgi:hypothetical protein
MSYLIDIKSALVPCTPVQQSAIGSVTDMGGAIEKPGQKLRPGEGLRDAIAQGPISG